MSKAALHFANAAKQVTMRPVVNEVVNERARIRQLQGQIDTLKRQLASIPTYDGTAENRSEALLCKPQLVHDTCYLLRIADVNSRTL